MPVDRYREVCAQHRWNVPADFNIAAAVCRRHATDRTRVAVYWEDEDGSRATLTFHQLQEQADRLSNALVALGIGRGDRVAIILPQRPETAIAHIACYQLGAITVPLSFLFGPDALEYRLLDAETKVAFVDAASLPNLAPIRDRLPQLKHVIGVAGAAESWTTDWASLQDKASSAVRGGNDTVDRPGAARVHQRDHRAAQGCADAAAVPARQPPRIRAFARPVSAARRRILVPGRLGLDRRAHGRAAADLVFRVSRRRISRALRSGARVAVDGNVSRPERVSVSDRAEDAHEGRPRTAPSVRTAVAQHHERRRGRGHDCIRVGQGRARRDDQRDVRADRDELHRRQFAHAVAGEARVDGPALSRSPHCDHR